MKKMCRKILYGYQIQNGELSAQPQEAEGVKRIFSLYLAGKSRDQIGRKRASSIDRS